MIAEQTLDQYRRQLAARTSTPGGGAAAGVSGAQAASLLAMVARFTRTDTDRMQLLAAQCDAAGERLLNLSDDDAEGFKSVMAAYAIKAGTETEKRVKHQALQDALRTAAAVPMAMLATAATLIPVSESLLADGNPNLITDVGIGAMELTSCLVACRMNLLINLGAIEDADFNRHSEQKLVMLQTGIESLSRVIGQVEQHLRSNH